MPTSPFDPGGSRPSPYVSPPPPKPKGTDWGKVSALAAVAAVVIAFLAYAIPSGSSPSPSSSQGGSSEGAGPTQPQGSPAPATSSTWTFSSPATSGPPIGCQQGEATITTWTQTAGSTWFSRQNATEQAENGMDAAIESGASGTVDSTLVIINNDFDDLDQAAMLQDGSSYDSIAAQIGSESQELKTECSTG